MNELIKKTEDFLKEKFRNSEYLNNNPSAKAYRLEHSYRVANIGKVIAERESFDVTEMIIACLLHDVAYCEEFKTQEDWLNHGRKSAQTARPFLEGLGLTKDRINDICFGIAIHVDDKADFEGISTPFAQSVGDADNIDRFDAYRIYEGLQYNKFSEMSLEDKKNKVSDTLNKLKKYREMQLGTATATVIWKERIDFFYAFYKKLEDQLLNSSGV